MISDYIKGKKQFDYPDDIHHGIKLHRLIDAFTDAHEATREAKEVFRPHYRLYSGAFVDVVYDHFLSNDASEFTESTLLDFSQNVYDLLDRQVHWQPTPFALFYPYMKEQNWLFNYRTRWGTAKSMHGVVRRAAYLNESETAFKIFEDNYQLLGDCYRHFWAFVKPFARHRFEELQSRPL
jgi:acyl carrier protein phosphodiesterase